MASKKRISETTRGPGRGSAPAIVELAERIQEDIRQRGLVPGDSYLSAAETAKMLKVGTAAANKALQLLEHRQVLIRRQRSGTFIGSASLQTAPSERRVNLIVDQSFLKSEGLLADGVLAGIQSILPEADLRFRFMPVTDDADFVHQVIDEALLSSQREGFVLVRASLTVQRLVADSGLPAVIFGTPYPSIKTIPWIDRDSTQSGILATQDLIKRGCDHILLLLRQQVMPGDHRLLDAVQTQISEAVPRLNFTLRCLPLVIEEIQQEVYGVLRQRTGKWGIICRSAPLAEGASLALEKLKSRIKKNDTSGEIIVTDIHRPGQKALPPWRHTQLLLTPQEIGEKIGQLLKEQFKGIPHTVEQISIPVQLRDGKPASLSQAVSEFP